MIEWQPIETAPKDGTRILGRGKFGNVYHCTWLFAVNEDEYDCWWNEQDDDEACPLWWMPALPDPKKE